MSDSIAHVSRGGALLALLLALAACGGDGPPKLVFIQVSPAVVLLPKGRTEKVVATGTWSDGSSRDLTARAAWSTADPNVATVDGGLVTAVGIGSSSIIATVDRVQGTGTAMVSAPVLTGFSLEPAAATLPVGSVLKLVPTGSFSDGTTRDLSWETTWTSSTPANVVVSGNGRALAAPGAPAGGTSTIQATHAGRTARSTVTVAARVPIAPTPSGDPLFAQQWYLRNTGQNGYADYAGVAGEDIAASATYGTDGWSGAGVKIAVIDTGLEIWHEDLSANMVPGSWNFVTGTADPTSSLTTGDHGTAVAGLIAMVQGNGKGGMGVAPGAGLNGYNFIASKQTRAYLVASLGGSSADPKSDDVWVFNQSYGYDNTTDFPVDPLEEAQYLSGVTALRGGKGALYVKAAGNGFRGFGPTSAPATCAAARALGVSCQNASMDPLNTLPYNVVVGAVNANGLRSSYSTSGSALWVAAPGGEFGLNASVFPPTSCTAAGGCPHYAYEPAMITTDQSGCAAGWSVSSLETGSLFDDGKVPENASCNYAATMNGTSSAAPVMAGVIALLLEANPNLGWRDVKHVLATTATQVDPSRAPVTVPPTDPDPLMGGYVAELPWTANAAGHPFHAWYGFGRVNVDRAVAMAKTYAVNLGSFADTGWISSPALNLPIPDASPVGATSVIPVPTNLVIEAVQVAVTAVHPYTGDLGIELVSPAGTKSILMNIRNGFNGTTGLAGMVLASNAFYGESSAGSWTIKVVDGDGAHKAPTAGQSLTGWQIRIYGH